MSSANNVIVLDAWAVLAYLNNEPAAPAVRQALRRARKKEVVALFSIINYGECLYVIEREGGFQQARQAAAMIDQLPLVIAPADRHLVFEAAHNIHLHFTHTVTFSTTITSIVHQSHFTDTDTTKNFQ